MTFEELIYLDGNDWQDLVDQLLRQRYGFKDYIRVPDEYRGDCGIEGYSTDKCGYQCYAPKEPLSNKDRYEKHRDKIAVDLRKLATYREVLEKLLKENPIQHWVFVVPKSDNKDLLTYAVEKQTEVRGWKLPFISEDFVIRVATPKDFYLEYKQIMAAGYAKLKIVSPTVTSIEVTDWAQQNDQLVATVDYKIAAAPGVTEPHDLIELRTILLQLYLEGSNTLEYLKDNYPELHAKLLELKNRKRLKLLVDKAYQSKTIPEVRDEFIAAIAQAFQQLDVQTAEMLGGSTITEWLIDCSMGPKKK